MDFQLALIIVIFLGIVLGLIMIGLNTNRIRFIVPDQKESTMSGRYWHWEGQGWYRELVVNDERHMYPVKYQDGEFAGEMVATQPFEDAEYVEDLPMDTGGQHGIFFEEEEEAE